MAEENPLNSYVTCLPLDGLLPQQAVDCVADLISSHQVFANQDRVHAGFFQLQNIISIVDSTFSHNQTVIGNLSAQMDRVRQICLKGSKISIVDSDQPSSAIEDTSQMLRLEELNECRHAEFTDGLVNAS